MNMKIQRSFNNLYFYCPQCGHIQHYETENIDLKKLVHITDQLKIKGTAIMIDENGCANLCLECVSQYYQVTTESNKFDLETEQAKIRNQPIIANIYRTRRGAYSKK